MASSRNLPSHNAAQKISNTCHLHFSDGSCSLFQFSQYGNKEINAKLTSVMGYFPSFEVFLTLQYHKLALIKKAPTNPWSMKGK